MTVLYDHRETPSQIPGMLAMAGVELQGQQLPVGDYILSEKLVVERKTGADLVASITDGRLFDQISRLREAYPRVVLLVEGRPQRFPEAGWKGALGSALRSGVSVLQTADADDSAEWISRLYQQETRGRSGPRGRPARRKADDPDRLAEQIISSLPGVSLVGAQRLLRHFGSVAGVFAATQTEIQAVEGFGKVRAAQLAEVLRWRYGDSPLRA